MQTFNWLENERSYNVCILCFDCLCLLNVIINLFEDCRVIRKSDGDFEEMLTEASNSRRISISKPNLNTTLQNDKNV